MNIRVIALCLAIPVGMLMGGVYGVYSLYQTDRVGPLYQIKRPDYEQKSVVTYTYDANSGKETIFEFGLPFFNKVPWYWVVYETSCDCITTSIMTDELGLTTHVSLRTNDRSTVYFAVIEDGSKTITSQYIPYENAESFIIEAEEYRKQVHNRVGKILN